MDMLAQIGGKRMAAPPAGAPGDDPIELQAAAERYRTLIELGESMGVIPQIEMWGGHPIIGRISTALSIAIECAHPKACFLGDVYHTYKGGCPFEGLKMMGPQAMQTFHFNDYPADPVRETINGSHRVYPGGHRPIGYHLQATAVGAYPGYLWKCSTAPIRAGSRGSGPHRFAKWEPYAKPWGNPTFDWTGMKRSPKRYCWLALLAFLLGAWIPMRRPSIDRSTAEDALPQHIGSDARNA